MKLLFIALLCGLLIWAGCSPSPGPSAADREVISTDQAPAAIGPYSQAIRVGNTLYLAGQIALNPRTGQLVEGGIEAQTRQVLHNLQAVLQAAGFSLAEVTQVQIFLADLNDYGAMNRVYGEFFPENPPARAVVQVSRIPRDALIEVMMVAVK
ncbi:MAG: RidA family protein [Calditrichaeota bacterium]|nr:MAG: RidA family protein [Calditrichota bacterium]